MKAIVVYYVTIFPLQLVFYFHNNYQCLALSSWEQEPLGRRLPSIIRKEYASDLYRNLADEVMKAW